MSNSDCPDDNDKLNVYEITDMDRESISELSEGEFMDTETKQMRVHRYKDGYIITGKIIVYKEFPDLEAMYDYVNSQ